MQTTSPAIEQPRFKGIGRAAGALGCTSQWLRIVLKNPERGRELHDRYLDYKASEAAAIDRLTKLEDLEIVDRLRHVEFTVANGNIPKKHRPRFAMALWELEKLALPFPAELTTPPVSDWDADPAPAPVPAAPDPEAEAIRAIRERQRAESDAKVEAAITVLRERLAAGPAAKPLSAETLTQEHREDGSVPMAASPAPAIGSAA